MSRFAGDGHQSPHSPSPANERQQLISESGRRDHGTMGRSPAGSMRSEDGGASADATVINSGGDGPRRRDGDGEGRQQQRRRQRRPENTPEEDEAAKMEELRAGAGNMVKLILPVVVCMAVVCISLLTIDQYKQESTTYLPYTPYHETGDISGGEKFGQALLNVLIILGIVVALTCVLVVLIKYRCYKAVTAWLVGASILALGWFSFYYFLSVVNGLNVPMDMLTGAIFGWNFCVAGVMAVHWRGPLRVQQFYLIATCVLISLIFIQYLPDWTAWVLLALIAVYDLVAVLAPFGPLRQLVEIAQERDEPLMPSLVYSTTNTLIWVTGMMADAPSRSRTTSPRRVAEDQVPLTSPHDSDDPSDLEEEVLTESAGVQAGHRAAREALATDTDSETDAAEAERQRRRRRAQQVRDSGSSGGGGQQRSAAASASSGSQDNDDEEDKGVKLGLGDFIFYSILVGRATKDSSGDFNVILACFIAIVIGLCLTVILLAWLRKALPALPFSIAFGLVFYFATAKVITPFTNDLISAQVFI